MSQEMPLSEDDWRKMFEPQTEQRLGEAYGMTQQELHSYMLSIFSRVHENLGRGDCLCIGNVHRGIVRIVNLPVQKEIKWQESYKGFQWNEFLLLMVATTHKYANRILRCDRHDWDSGNMDIQTPAGERESMHDTQITYEKYFRKPRLLNPSGNPTYEAFRHRFEELKGDEQQLARDYETLFNEPLPHWNR
ncbi:MAG TPA: hypothetical protein VJK51_05010 [Candidatus Nanoarchaeia archaeon]|nr:hypothetical protein [Candidatus Nanoarchaeia archaeon]